MLAQTSIYGIDVSDNNRTVDWSRVIASRCGFALIKAAEGASYRDTQFAANWAATKAEGLPRGGYHFFRPYRNGEAQAKNFLSALGTDTGELPCSVDVEVLPETPDIPSFLDDMRTWLTVVGRATGHAPWIYTCKRVWQLLGNPLGFEAYGLWVTHWNTPRPSLPPSWQSFNAWQYSDEGSIPGVEGPVDLDVIQVQSGIDVLTAELAMRSPRLWQ